MAVGGKGRSGQVNEMMLTEQQTGSLRELGNFGVRVVFLQLVSGNHFFK